MKERKDLHDELGDSPLLQALKKNDDGFRVPDDYFDTLESEVYRQLDAIGARRQPAAFAAPDRRPSWWQLLQRLWHPRTALAFAGVFAVALAGWWYFTASPAVSSTEMAAANLSDEDAEAYLLDNALELDPQQIAQVIPEEELPPIDVSEPGATSAQKSNPKEIQIRPEDLENVLKDMSDEELEKLL